MASTDNRKTPIFDWDTGEFATDLANGIKTATGAAAVEQIILKAQQTMRGLFLIYAADPEVADSKGHTYGSDVDNVRKSNLPESAKLSEMERAVQEALIYDPWIKAVRDVSVQRQAADEAVITATIDHIYGTSAVTFRG